MLTSDVLKFIPNLRYCFTTVYGMIFEASNVIFFSVLEEKRGQKAMFNHSFFLVQNLFLVLCTRTRLY